METRSLSRNEKAIAISRPTDIIHNVDDLMRLSELLLKSGLLPFSVKTKEAVAATILLGREIGFSPMTSFNLINVIQGKPTISPQGMIALARRTGELEDIQVEHTETETKVTVKRKGNNPLTTKFSDADATAMNLMTKDNWIKQKKVMRQWRAVSANFRLTFPDVISGMYLPEEMGADVNEEGEYVETKITASPEQAKTDWAKRGALVDRIKSGIPYFESFDHVLRGLGSLETTKDIEAFMTDDQIFEIVNAVAKKLADKKAQKAK